MTEAAIQDGAIPGGRHGLRGLRHQDRHGGAAAAGRRGRHRFGGGGRHDRARHGAGIDLAAVERKVTGLGYDVAPADCGDFRPAGPREPRTRS